jgi:hypothetical protein
MRKIFIPIKSNPLLIIVLLFFNVFTINAQTTNFSGSSKIQSNGFTGALYEVKIDRNKGFTYVKIQQVPTKDMRKMSAVFPSFNAKIKSGNFEAEYLGILQSDGTIRRLSCSDDFGWDNVETGVSHFITYVFNGAIPPGLKVFSLIDDGSFSGCKGYRFNNYTTLNNPDNHPKTKGYLFGWGHQLLSSTGG